METLAISHIGTHTMRGAIIGGTMINKHLERELTSYLQNNQYLLREGITPIDAARILSWGRTATSAKIDIGNTMPDSLTSPTHRTLVPKTPIFMASSSNDEGDFQAADKIGLAVDL